MADAIKPIGSQLRGYTQHQQSHKYKQWCETEPTLGGREKWQALFILCKKTKLALLTDWWSKRDTFTSADGCQKKKKKWQVLKIK